MNSDDVAQHSEWEWDTVEEAGCKEQSVSGNVNIISSTSECVMTLASSVIVLARIGAIAMYKAVYKSSVLRKILKTFRNLILSVSFAARAVGTVEEIGISTSLLTIPELVSTGGSSVDILVCSNLRNYIFKNRCTISHMVR